MRRNKLTPSGRPWHELKQSMYQAMKPDRIMRLPEVLNLTGLSRSTLSRLEKGGQFPKRRLLSARAIGWNQGAVLGWLEAQRKGERWSEEYDVG